MPPPVAWAVETPERRQRSQRYARDPNAQPPCASDSAVGATPPTSASGRRLPRHPDVQAAPHAAGKTLQATSAWLLASLCQTVLGFQRDQLPLTARYFAVILLSRLLLRSRLADAAHWAFITSIEDALSFLSVCMAVLYVDHALWGSALVTLAKRLTAAAPAAPAAPHASDPPESPSAVGDAVGLLLLAAI